MPMNQNPSRNNQDRGPSNQKRCLIEGYPKIRKPRTAKRHIKTRNGPTNGRGGPETNASATDTCRCSGVHLNTVKAPNDPISRRPVRQKLKSPTHPMRSPGLPDSGLSGHMLVGSVGDLPEPGGWGGKIRLTPHVFRPPSSVASW